MKNTTAIIDLIYPEVEKSLDKNTQSYKKYLSKFINSTLMHRIPKYILQQMMLMNCLNH